MTVHFDEQRTSWFYVIDLPRAADGKRRQAKKRGFPTEAVAREAEREIVQRVAKTAPAADGTVRATLDKWLEEMAINCSPTTIQGHRTKFRCYVYPHIGRLPLYQVTASTLNQLYLKLGKEGARGGKPLAPTSVLSVHKALVSGLRAAGLDIKERDVRTPKGKKGRRGSGRGSRPQCSWSRRARTACTPPTRWP